MERLNFKKLDPRAVTPKYMTSGAAGFDLTAISRKRIGWFKYEYDTGLAFEIPQGQAGFLFPRSSIHKTGMELSNAVGVGDSDFRGSFKAIFRLNLWELLQSFFIPNNYKVGDRIIQMVIIDTPQKELVEITELSSTNRGTGGFGSTGK